MTYRLKILSSLLILLLLLIYKPVKAFEEVLFFALPFLGAITQHTNEMEYDYDKTMEEFAFNIKNLNYIPVGGCKVYAMKDPETGGTINGRACKQSDGSWKKTTYDYQKDN